MKNAGVTADVSAVLKRCDKLTDAYGPRGLSEVGRAVQGVLRRDTQQAFGARTDPNTGRGWRAPKFPQSHPLLNLSGTLKALSETKQKVGDVRVWVKGLIPDGTKLVAYNRRATTRRTVGRSIGDYVGIALLHHYGRRDRRLPPRKFAGISKAGRNRIEHIAKQHSDRARLK